MLFRISAAGALYGPLHGGATEAVLRMLEKIGTVGLAPFLAVPPLRIFDGVSSLIGCCVQVEKIPGFLAAVKAKKERLMGFGHRVYRNYDPRAK